MVDKSLNGRTKTKPHFRSESNASPFLHSAFFHKQPVEIEHRRVNTGSFGRNHWLASLSGGILVILNLPFTGRMVTGRLLSKAFPVT